MQGYTLILKCKKKNEHRKIPDSYQGFFCLSYVMVKITFSLCFLYEYYKGKVVE